MPELRVGTRIDIVFENEINKSNAHYMKALVYDYENKNIIISQTSPALNRNFLNRRIMVTFLANVEKRVLRFGFAARLIDLLTNYKISASNIVEALVLKQFDSPEQVDFRMHFRVRPPSQSNISLFLKEEKVNLLDISVGGAKFAYAKSNALLYGDVIDCKLKIDTHVFDLKGRVRNIITPQSPSKALLAKETVQYIGIEFEHNNKQFDVILGRAIIDIERQMLAEGKMN